MLERCLLRHLSIKVNTTSPLFCKPNICNANLDRGAMPTLRCSQFVIFCRKFYERSILNSVVCFIYFFIATFCQFVGIPGLVKISHHFYYCVERCKLNFISLIAEMLNLCVMVRKSFLYQSKFFHSKSDKKSFR